MKTVLSILVVIFFIVVVILFKHKIFSLLVSKKEEIDILYKLLGIVGIFAAILTLYFSFLKPPSLNLKISKSAILIWHDVMLKCAPMIDVFCTIQNSGANSIVIDKIEAELSRDGKKLVKFDDFLFLKYNANMNAWVQDEYSHPIVVNKYAEKSMMIGLKSDDLQHIFQEGEYTLKVKALTGKKRYINSKILFFLTKEQTERISTNKSEAKNKAIEIPLK